MRPRRRLLLHDVPGRHVLVRRAACRPRAAPGRACPSERVASGTVEPTRPGTLTSRAFSAARMAMPKKTRNVRPRAPARSSSFPSFQTRVPSGMNASIVPRSCGRYGHAGPGRRRRRPRARGRTAACAACRAASVTAASRASSISRASTSAEARVRREERVHHRLVLLGLARAGGVDEAAARGHGPGGAREQRLLLRGKRRPAPLRCAASGCRDRAAPCRGPSTARRRARGRRPARTAPRRGCPPAPGARSARGSRGPSAASSRIRRGRASHATIRPRPSMSAASAVALPPGEAQRSSTRVAGPRAEQQRHELRRLVLHREAARARRAAVRRGRRARPARSGAGVVSSPSSSSSCWRSASREITSRLARSVSGRRGVVELGPGGRVLEAVAIEPARDQPVGMRLRDAEIVERGLSRRVRPGPRRQAQAVARARERAQHAVDEAGGARLAGAARRATRRRPRRRTPARDRGAAADRG